MQHEHTITYHLTDEQEARLMALTVRYNRIVMPGTGKGVTAEGLLSSLLLAGSALMIDERMNGIAAALDAAEERGGTEV